MVTFLVVAPATSVTESRMSWQKKSTKRKNCLYKVYTRMLKQQMVQDMQAWMLDNRLHLSTNKKKTCYVTPGNHTF